MKSKLNKQVREQPADLILPINSSYCSDRYRTSPLRLAPSAKTAIDGRVGVAVTSSILCISITLNKG